MNPVTQTPNKFPRVALDPILVVVLTAALVVKPDWTYALAMAVVVGGRAVRQWLERRDQDARAEWTKQLAEVRSIAVRAANKAGLRLD